MIEVLTQITASAMSTVCFASLLHVPKRHLWCCGFVGMLGWMCYWGMMKVQPSPVIASLVAVIPLAFAVRVMAILRKAPSTMFLIPGIFPLVPGAGIYYTAYSFITGDSVGCAAKGAETLKIAVAMAMGIALVMSLPIKTNLKPAKFHKQADPQPENGNTPG